MSFIEALNTFCAECSFGNDPGVLEIRLTARAYDRLITEIMPMIRYKSGQPNIGYWLDFGQTRIFREYDSSDAKTR